MESHLQLPEMVDPTKQIGLNGVSRTIDDGLEDAFRELVTGDFKARWQAAKVLKTYGEEVHERLIAIAQSSAHDPDLIGFIVGILGVDATPEILLTLINLLKSSTDEELRDTIILTLGKQGPSQVDALLELADDPNLEFSVVRALVQINHPSTISGLLKFSSNNNPAIRTLAIEALGQFHSPRISEQLRKGLTDTSSTVRLASLKALGLRQAEEIDPSLISKVSECLYDTNSKVSDTASKALGRYDSPLAIEALWRRLIASSSPTPLTQSLIRALGWSSHPKGIDYLIQLLSQLSSVRQPAVTNEPKLVSTGPSDWPTEMVNGLIQTIANVESSDYQGKIASQLTELLSKDIKPFDEIQVKQQLIMAIARLQQDSSIPDLLNALAIDDDRLRFHIIAALKQINPDLSHEKLVAYNQDSELESTLKAGIEFAVREW